MLGKSLLSCGSQQRGRDSHPDRRAEAAWELRELLESGHRWEQRRLAGEQPGRLVGLAVPPAHRDQLIRELCAIEWATTGDRKIQLEGKGTVKAKLGKGQSPDYFDALCMAICSDGVTSFDIPSEPVAF